MNATFKVIAFRFARLFAQNIINNFVERAEDGEFDSEPRTVIETEPPTIREYLEWSQRQTT